MYDQDLANALVEIERLKQAMRLVLEFSKHDPSVTVEQILATIRTALGEE